MAITCNTFTYGKKILTNLGPKPQNYQLRIEKQPPEVFYKKSLS